MISGIFQYLFNLIYEGGADIKGLGRLTQLDEALKGALRSISHRPGVVEVPLHEAFGRYLAEDIIAGLDVPPFDVAAMDGYAVRSIDTLNASFKNPAVLRVKGVVRVGSKPGEHEVGEGEAFEILTGAPLPRGADAVVRYENTRRVGDQYVEIYSPVSPMDNVHRKGEDIRAGEKILTRGRRLQPWDLAVIASLGISRVRIYRAIVSIICTGDELVEIESFDRGEYRGVVNSTRFAIEGLVRSLGFEARYMGIVGDDEDEIYRSILRALDGSDAVITSGGTSLGSSDNTVEAVKKLNPEYMVHGIAMRPGKPTGIAVVKGKPIIMLSGFPAAAIIGFEALARPVLLKMVEAGEEPKATVKGILTRRVTTPAGTRTYARVKIYRGGDGKTYIEPLTPTGGGILSTLVRGNGILVIPEDREGYDEGEEVEAILLRGIE